MKFLLLSLLAGLAAACGFAPLELWPLTIAALAALLWLVEHAPRLRSALARGWWFGVGIFALGNNWIATAFTFQAAMPAWLGWIAVLLLALYLALYPAMAAGLAWKYGRRDRMRLILLFAAAWIVTEWLRATVFTGFAWNPIGVALLPMPLAGLAPAIGTYGLSGIALLFAGALLLVFEKGSLRSLHLALPLVAAALVGRMTADPVREGQGMKVRIVQPDIGQQDKWREGYQEIAFRRLGGMSADTAPGPRLLLWPEAAVTDALQDTRPIKRAETARLRALVAGLIEPDDILLGGGITIRSRDGSNASSATNSVFAIRGDGRILGRYDKAHLVPYGEYLPMRPLLSGLGLSRLAPGAVDFDAGPGPRTLDVPAVGAVGFQLCYEIIFSGEVVDRARRPDFIFNPSNDAWFGAWGPPQHLAQARMRALEEGLPVLRSTPTGISAVIDAQGRVLHGLPLGKAGVVDARLPAAKPPTLFARFGNILPFLFAFALVAIAFAVRGKTR